MPVRALDIDTKPGTALSPGPTMMTSVSGDLGNNLQ